ncbi:hypothetical protein [Chthonobacter rhizosphaerae]|uniref:hypothetical protein n=1 Tax=Chthonobacter rhizosphaerae TaxID=2735553 RepID=UPI0015EEC563|nr:hypothetical protein [Chthonobacter rhizosphaerae]
MARGPAKDHPFKVELWSDDDIVRLEELATASTWALAKVAYDEAVKTYPGKRIIIRQGIRVVTSPD